MLGRAVQGNYCAYPVMTVDPLLANVRASSAFAGIVTAGKACQERLRAGG
ncbi:MAG: hypothetical protein QM736_14120 [Vicinamibacterales bacterium]